MQAKKSLFGSFLSLLTKTINAVIIASDFNERGNMVHLNFSGSTQELLTKRLARIPMPGRKHKLIQQITNILPGVMNRVPKDGSWGFDTHKPGDPDLGFVFKRGKIRKDDTREDVKAYLHWNPAVPNLLRQAGASGRNLDMLMQLCGELFNLALTESRKLIQDLDWELPHNQLYNKFTNPAGPRVHGMDDHVLRILIYQEVHPDMDGVIAQDHNDRNGLTLALYENAEGLEYFDEEKQSWIPVSSTPDSALAFPGLKMAEVTNDVIQPLRHRVMARSEAEDGVIRVSVVMFTHPYNGYCQRATH